ncbi:hypothetical protein CRENPOLYSF1_330079 [Crenothrix polyspora]|uniref:Uncharacterized protein n=1 Tax=Crenothrix polyspora TaxID=360316 RepID=A0A1R4H9H2_9GAMM|nr:hypothetical protein CRENPOLYSF1_330079 [Crenothrix polyspora]
MPSSEHVTVEPVHTPLEQTSLCVQALLSSQDAPVSTGVYTHPRTRSQLSVVHELLSSQTNVVQSGTAANTVFGKKIAITIVNTIQQNMWLIL